MTGFTNGVEQEMHFTNADWQALSVVDGRLITRQNPASSTVAAQNLVNLLAAKKAA